MSLRIFIYGLIISIFFSGQVLAEYNLATGQEEQVIFSTESEVKLGRSLARKIEKEFKLSKDAKLGARLEQIGQRLAAVCDRKDISYCFRALKSEKVNAFALPGGYIYVDCGLIDKADSDDEVAACLAHEIGHIAARHSMKRLQAALSYNILSILALAATKDPGFKRGTDLAFNQIMLGYSREDEFLADQLAVKYMQKAGYDARAVISLLEKLKEIEKNTPLRPLVESFQRSHPYLSERIGAAKLQVYGKMDFSDYINKGD